MKKRRISKVAKDKLGRLSIDTIISLNEIRKKLELRDAVVDIVRQLIEEEKDYILSLNSADDKLSIKHADAKGRIGSLTVLIHMIEGAEDEIERREEKK